MAKISIVIKGGTPNCKIVTKDNITYAIMELQASWKLVSTNTDIKIELIFTKKDVPTMKDLLETLDGLGYDIKENIE